MCLCFCMEDDRIPHSLITHRNESMCNLKVLAITLILIQNFEVKNSYVLNAPVNDGSYHQTCISHTHAEVLRLRRRVDDTTFRGNPKPRAEILAGKFHMDAYNFAQTKSLINLVNKVAKEYLGKCPPVIYYDSFVEKSEGMILEYLFKTFPISFYHGEINEKYIARNRGFQQRIDTVCRSYILFLSDPLMTSQIIGAQTESRVVLISRSTQWKLRDFLASPKSANIVNLLVIGESLVLDPLRERSYVLYTHKLYTDGLGSNTPIVLTSWIKGALSRPHVQLFPPKFENGFAGHRFQVSSFNQPPYIFRLKTLDATGNQNVHWDGIEYRLLSIIAETLNFTIDISEPPMSKEFKSPIESIQRQLKLKHVDIGMSGVYITDDRLEETDMSVGHSRDCATFITLASKALPKYRAIMGPFQWPVWLALTLVYLGAVFPIVYSDRLTLSHLIGNWGEMENMFWYVFGMFTNSFTFSGQYSWGTTQKISTRILIGSYWVFTIIITACYTGSIIAFVTLPAFPDTIDSVRDLLGLFFRVGTLDNGGWERWFQNSTHEVTAKIYKKMEFVSSFEEGIGNVTQSFFWNYAFLGSSAQLEYLVQSNYTNENFLHRSALHLSEECFALFQIGYLLPRDAVYKQKLDSMILLAQQSGILNKISNEVKWTMQRSSSGKLLQASTSNGLRERGQEERQLTTADTEGMFLLMGIGYLTGAIALVSEIVGGITNKCRQILKRSRKSFSSSAWSSRRNSNDLQVERTDAQQEAHDDRKAKRRQNDADDLSKNQSFGIREFHLTRKTLKELYGNYYKAEPQYVLKDGKLLLENDDVASDSTVTSRNSSASLNCPIPGLRIRTKAMVLADIDVGSQHSTNDITEQDVNETLANLDGCLEAYKCHNIMEETAEDVRQANDRGEEIVEGISLFGSKVEMRENEATRVEQLNLYIGGDRVEHKK